MSESQSNESRFRHPPTSSEGAELDAAFFHLYGLARDDAAYILSTFSGMTQGDPDLPFDQRLTQPAHRILHAYDHLASLT